MVTALLGTWETQAGGKSTKGNLQFSLESPNALLTPMIMITCSFILDLGANHFTSPGTWNEGSLLFWGRLR